MSRSHVQRDGFALTTAIVALVVLGLVVTGGFFAASQEDRVAMSSRYADEALYVAEHGMNTVVGTWMLPDYDDVPADTPAVVVDTVRVGSSAVGRATVEVKRLGDRLFFVTSRGRVVRGGRYAGAERVLGMTLRTVSLDVKTDRALQSLRGVVVGGSSKVSGVDQANPNWANKDECPDVGTKAGIVAKDTSKVSTQGSKASIEGDPPKLEDPTMDESAFLDFGDWSYDDLAAMASKVIEDGENVPGTEAVYREDGSCDTTARWNWGEPQDSLKSCHYYFPIIHAKGDLELATNSAGQGILLVDGDLSIRGGYEFSGIIVVKGKVETGSGNSKIYGTLLVMGENTNELSKIKDCDYEGCESKVEGNPIVHLSSCAIERAVKYNKELSRAFPITERSWVDMSGAGAAAY